MTILASGGSNSAPSQVLIVLSVTVLRPNQVQAAFRINKSRGVLFGAVYGGGRVLKLN
jgi:hypothetical protein